jgi:hypothetical protein
MICNAPQPLTLEEMQSLRDILDLAIAREKEDLDLFAISPSDLRANLRWQFDKLHELLAGAGINVSENAGKNESGVIRWTITRRIKRSEAAILRLSKEGVWSIEPRGIQTPPEGHIATLSLTHLLQKNQVDLATLGGWNLAT